MSNDLRSRDVSRQKSEIITRSWYKAKGASPVVSQAFMSPVPHLGGRSKNIIHYLNPLSLHRGKTSDVMPLWLALVIPASLGRMGVLLTSDF